MIDKKEYMRQYRKKNRLHLNAQKLISTQKKRLENKQKAIDYLGGKCNDCGNVFDHWVYDFHHVDPTEKVCDPSSLMHLSWDSVFEEVRKCVLLCANCHRTTHYNLTKGKEDVTISQ